MIAMNNEHSSSSSIVSLLRDLRTETSTLIQQQVELAKVELTEKIGELVSNAVQIGIGAFVAFAGAIVLILGVADLSAMIMIPSGLDADMATWLSRAVIGILVAALGGLLMMKAKKSMASQDIIPEKTIDSLQDSKEWAQDKLPHSP